LPYLLGYLFSGVVGLEPTTIILKTIVLPIKLYSFFLINYNYMLPIGLEPITNSLQNYCSTIELRKLLDRVGFEPTILLHITVFKTIAISLSATYLKA
jgi:hypothetical protein